MSDTKYTYAVARIRALELSLFSASTIEQLLACKSYEAALQFLEERGWGDGETRGDMEAMLSREEEKTWETIRELKVDMSLFDVLSYPHLFHNLKAAVKEFCTGESQAQLYYEDCALGRKELLAILEDKDYAALPESMREPAREACETLLRTRDGQLCDVIIDRGCLLAIGQAGRRAEDAILKNYAESTVAVADIKIAVRCQKTGKSLDFVKDALAPCDTLDIQRLALAAVSGLEAICQYLQDAGYGEAAEAMRESSSAFERWCDNRIIHTIQPEKYHPFSIGPLVAYVLARENEIKTVRIILTGRQNGLTEEAIRERVREMYV